MTKNIKKENKRSRTKYPALDKGVNLSSRKDYIEPDYINGVYDKDGNQVIRPMTEKEKAWLNQYYEETIVTNFYHDKELKNLNQLKKSIIEDETVKWLMDVVKVLKKDNNPDKKRIRELKEIIKLTKKQNEELYADDLYLIEEELKKARKEKLLYPDKEDHKQFYTENNARNNCIFNKSRITNRLIHLDIEDYDNLLLDKIKHLDVENAIIHEIEHEIHEEQEKRIENILKDVKKIIKKKSKS